jgi:hypothetical protein
VPPARGTCSADPPRWLRRTRHRTGPAGRVSFLERVALRAPPAGELIVRPQRLGDLIVPISVSVRSLLFLLALAGSATVRADPPKPKTDAEQLEGTGSCHSGRARTRRYSS